MFRLVAPTVCRRLAVTGCAACSTTATSGCRCCCTTAAPTMTTSCSSSSGSGSCGATTSVASAALRRPGAAAQQRQGGSAVASSTHARRYASSGGGSNGSGGGKDYYKILGISRDADVKEVKKAYRKRALETHPDQGGNKEEFAEVAEAYEVLSSPERRQVYDQYGAEAAAQMHAAGGAGGGPGGFAGGRSAEDIFAEFFKGGFGDMFGGMAGRRGGGAGGGGGGTPTVPPAEVKLRLTLEEVYTGVHKSVRVTRPQVCSECTGFGTKSKSEKPKCAQCNGSGHVVQQHRLGPGMVQQTISDCPRCHGTGSAARPDDVCARCHGNGYRHMAQDVSVNIPAGVPSNVTLVLRGEGGTMPGAQPGDLHVHVDVAPHRVFTRRGDDLVLQKEVTLQEALLGLHMPLKLLDGRAVHVETPEEAVLKHDGVLKLRGEGMPSTSGGRGDVYIFVKVRMPAKLSERQRELVREAFGSPERDAAASSGNTIKARVLRETREQVEDEQRHQWAAQEHAYGGGGGGGGHRSRHGGMHDDMGGGAGHAGGGGARQRQRADMGQADCVAQ